MVSRCCLSAQVPERPLAFTALGSRKELRQLGIAQQAYLLLRSELPRVLAQVAGRHIDALLRSRRFFSQQ